MQGDTSSAPQHLIGELRKLASWNQYGTQSAVIDLSKLEPVWHAERRD